MALLTVKNLVIGYESGVVSEGISFEVSAGDYLCVTGENGSGKSTLIKTILGLTAKLGGEIVFGDGLSKNEIGYLPQQTSIQRDFPASVREIVLSGCQSGMGRRPFYGKKEKDKAKNAMEKMGINDLEGRCYGQLSGGQQQRVLLARALCAADKILFLDEPVSGLDPDATKQMYDLIEKLNQEGMAIVMITHDVRQARKYASHILHFGEEMTFTKREEMAFCG